MGRATAAANLEAYEATQKQASREPLVPNFRKRLRHLRCCEQGSDAAYYGRARRTQKDELFVVMCQRARKDRGEFFLERKTGCRGLTKAGRTISDPPSEEWFPRGKGPSRRCRYRLEAGFLSLEACLQNLLTFRAHAAVAAEGPAGRAPGWFLGRLRVWLGTRGSYSPVDEGPVHPNYSTGAWKVAKKSR